MLLCTAPDSRNRALKKTNMKKKYIYWDLTP